MTTMLTGFLKRSTVNHICICVCLPPTHLPTCTRACLRTAERGPELPPSPAGHRLPALGGSPPAQHLTARASHHGVLRTPSVGEKRNYPSLHCVLRPAWKVNRDEEVKAAAFALAVMCWLTSGSQATSNCLMMAPHGGSESTWILLTLTLQAP